MEPRAVDGQHEHGTRLSICGLEDGRGAEPIRSFTIIVADADALLKSIHDCMPVILDSRVRPCR